VSGARAKLSEARFWPNAFRAMATSRELTEFSVLDVQPLDYGAAAATVGAATDAASGDAGEASWGAPMEVEVARSRDLGVTDERFSVVSHIGSLLQPGDTVLGFDFANHNLGDDI